MGIKSMGLGFGIQEGGAMTLVRSIRTGRRAVVVGKTPTMIALQFTDTARPWWVAIERFNRTYRPA